jgi:hypothetical protein
LFLAAGNCKSIPGSHNLPLTNTVYYQSHNPISQQDNWSRNVTRSNVLKYQTTQTQVKNKQFTEKKQASSSSNSYSLNTACVQFEHQTGHQLFWPTVFLIFCIPSKTPQPLSSTSLPVHYSCTHYLMLYSQRWQYHWYTRHNKLTAYRLQ